MTAARARRAIAAAALIVSTVTALAACTPQQAPAVPAVFTANPLPGDPPGFQCPPGQHWKYYTSGWGCVR
jgi:hypothetical protein